MSLLSSLTTDQNIKDEVDSLGGGDRTLDSGIYHFTIQSAYITKSKSEATGITLDMKDAEGRELKYTTYVTSGKEKGCKNYYENTKGEKNYLPGFNIMNSLCLLTLGKELSAMDTEEKLVKVWSASAKAEVPTKVPVLADLIGQEIKAAVVKQLVDKTKLNEATKVYEATGETRNQNEIEKFFRASDSKTTFEIRNNVDQPEFITQWSEKNTGKVIDKTGKAAKSTGGTAGKPSASKPTNSLFGNPS